MGHDGGRPPGRRHGRLTTALDLYQRAESLAVGSAPGHLPAGAGRDRGLARPGRPRHPGLARPLAGRGAVPPRGRWHPGSVRWGWRWAAASCPPPPAPWMATGRRPARRRRATTARWATPWSRRWPPPWRPARRRRPAVGGPGRRPRGAAAHRRAARVTLTAVHAVAGRLVPGEIDDLVELVELADVPWLSALARAATGLAGGGGSSRARGGGRVRGPGRSVGRRGRPLLRGARVPGVRRVAGGRAGGAVRSPAAARRGRSSAGAGRGWPRPWPGRGRPPGGGAGRRAGRRRGRGARRPGVGAGGPGPAGRGRRGPRAGRPGRGGAAPLGCRRAGPGDRSGGRGPGRPAARPVREGGPGLRSAASAGSRSSSTAGRSTWARSSPGPGRRCTCWPPTAGRSTPRAWSRCARHGGGGRQAQPPGGDLVAAPPPRRPQPGRRAGPPRRPGLRPGAARRGLRGRGLFAAARDEPGGGPPRRRGPGPRRRRPGAGRLRRRPAARAGPGRLGGRLRRQLAADAAELALLVGETALGVGSHDVAAAACARGLDIDRHDGLWRLLVHAQEAGGDLAAAACSTERYHDMLRELGLDTPLCGDAVAAPQIRPWRSA